MAIAKTPFGKPNRAKTWKDVNAQAAGDPDPRLRPAADQRHARFARRADHDPAVRSQSGMAALKKSDETKFKAICTGVRTDGAYIEAGENDNLIVQKLAANPGTHRLLRLQLPRGECRPAEGRRDQRRPAELRDRSAASNIPARGRSTSTSRTRMPRRSRRSAPSSPNSPRKARSGPRAICSSTAWSPRRTGSAPAARWRRATWCRSTSPASNKPQRQRPLTWAPAGRAAGAREGLRTREAGKRKIRNDPQDFDRRAARAEAR